MAFPDAACRLPVLWDFGVDAQLAAGKTPDQWVDAAEQDLRFIIKNPPASPPLRVISRK